VQDDRKLEDYRRHKILAAYHDGAYRGRAWKSNNLLIELVGSSLDDVLTQLRARIDGHLSDQAASRTAPPAKREYVEAFRKMLPDLTAGHIAMLRAHCKATERCLTAGQLAKAAGYRSYGAANLQYGLVGRMLFDELSTDLPRRADGSLIYTCALAAAPSNHAEPEEQWVWEMLPEVAAAIEELGFRA